MQLVTVRGGGGGGGVGPKSYWMIQGTKLLLAVLKNHVLQRLPNEFSSCIEHVSICLLETTKSEHLRTEVSRE